MFLPVSVCLSVCQQDYSKTRAWIWMKCLISSSMSQHLSTRNTMLRIDRCRDMDELIFEPDPVYSPDAGTGLLSPISYKRCYVQFYAEKIPLIRIGGPIMHRGVVLKWFYSLSRRITFVGGTCALSSALLLQILLQ